MGKLFSKAKIGSSAFSQVFAPFTDCEMKQYEVSPSLTSILADDMGTLSMKGKSKHAHCVGQGIEAHTGESMTLTGSAASVLSCAWGANLACLSEASGLHLDDDIRHTIAHNWGSGRIPLVHLLGELNMRSSGLVLFCILRKTLQHY